MKYTPSEKRLIKRFEKKFRMEFIVLPVTSEKYKDFLIKEVRRAEKRGMIDWTKVAFKKDNQTLSKYKSQFNIAH